MRTKIKRESFAPTNISDQGSSRIGNAAMAAMLDLVEQEKKLSNQSDESEALLKKSQK
ncbi:hypothetical protein [Nitrosococcus watsonii]|uniref:hypothetical protein n=1 Tax=Nitrosococcus watsonii TaxID=473531 RepID=UPI0002E8AAE8|nr:hypothetical protein [Nitrosococcus watsonii]